MKVTAYSDEHNIDLSGGAAVTASTYINTRTSLGSNTPKVESGSGTPGIGPQASAWDHVHPALAGGTSFGSNSNSVSTANSAGASSSNSRADHVHKGVASLAKSGSAALVGDVTLTGGTNVTLTQSGNDISIASTGGGGGGGTQSYIGYNTIGATWTTVSANREYMKKVTLAATTDFNSIDIYLRPSTDNVLGISVAILTDTAGTPDILIAANTSGGSAMYLSNSASMPGAGRWLSIPIGAHLTAADYWLAVMFENGRVDIANDSSGTDKFFTSSLFSISGTYPSAFAITTTAVKYSIRASVMS